MPLFIVAMSLQLLARDPMMVEAFAPSITRSLPLSQFPTQLRVMIAPENAEMEYRQKPSDDDVSNSNSSWKEVAGGFVPQLGNILRGKTSLSMQQQSTAAPKQSFKIRQVSTLEDYKRFVVDDVRDDVDTITVVRFYAPWCRACQAVQQRYYRLAQQYEKQSLPNASSKTVVRFIECPVTKDNAVLHQGLGVPSLPYGHIYHSAVGLVEELKLNKNVFAQFEEVLASYVRGFCALPEEETPQPLA